MRHGSVIYKGGRLISCGINRNKYHEEYGISYNVPPPSVHAEEKAINIALSNGADLKGAIIYVARTSKRGYPAISKPCPKCEKLIREHNIKKVVYTEDHSNITGYTI